MRGLHGEVKRVGHETIRINLPAGLARGFGEGCQKTLAVEVLPEDRFAAVAPIHEVVNSSRIVDFSFFTSVRAISEFSVNGSESTPSVD